MTPEQWQKVKDVFQSAIEREPEQRASFVAQACSEQSTLREEVERLISLHEEAGDFIEMPVTLLDRDLLKEVQEALLIGKRVGPYKIVREIGQGGMGAVYLAVRADDQYQKRVAIKLIKHGLDSESILRRFRNERQILASLDHPNIAKLLDGGTTEDGLPYFVMDYIEGLPIDHYCDRHKLATVERLKLFRTVCSAVHCAHQSLVVHRDLKPGNILITADGTPKLLDFGIAKLMNPELTAANIEQTLTVLGPMTPRYASPEQVRGESITTASDVYSLGVVLYELLTGHAPYRFTSHDPQGIAQVICEEEPRRPSTAVRQIETVPAGDNQTEINLTPEIVSKTREGQPDKLHRRLSGDLDNIVLMAMRKEPRRRYASVEQFSEDIRRHLEGLPVIARKDTFLYRSSKFISRNKVAVFAAALIIVSLFTGLGVALWQASVARAEKIRAEKRFNEVRKLANSMMFELNDKIEREPTEARSLLVNMALEYLDRLAQEAGGDLTLQSELATAYDKVGDILGNPYKPNLGDPAGAIESYKKALSIRQGLYAADPTNVETRRALARSHSQIAMMMWTVSDTAGVIENVGKSLEIYDDLLKKQPDDRDRRDHAVASGMLAEALVWSGDIATAREKNQASLTVLESLATANPTDRQARRDLATAYDKQGVILHAAGDIAGALVAYNKQLVLAEEAARVEPNDFTRDDLAFSLNRVGDALYAMGSQTNSVQHYREALDYFGRALKIAEEVATRDSKNVRAQRDVSVSFNKVGDALWMTGDVRGALDSYRKSLAIRESLAARKDYAFSRNDLAVSYGRIGEALAELGDPAGGILSHKKAVGIYESLSEADPTNAVTRRDVGDSRSLLAKAFMTAAEQGGISVQQRIDYLRQARVWYQRALDVFNDLSSRGLLRSADANQPTLIAEAITKCEAALGKLGASAE